MRALQGALQATGETWRDPRNTRSFSGRHSLAAERFLTELMREIERRTPKLREDVRSIFGSINALIHHRRIGGVVCRRAKLRLS